MQLNLNKVALALAAAGVISGLAGCGGGSGISTSPFNNDPVKVSSQVNTVTLAFVDAITGAPITESVKVKLKGQSAGMLTTLTAANGTTSPLNDGIELDTTLSQDAKVPGTVTFLANFGSGGSFTATPDSSTWIAYPQTISKNGTVVFKLLKKKSNDTGTYVTAAGSGNVSNGDVSVVAPNDLGAAKITIKQDSSLGPLSVAVVKFADSKVNDLDATLTQGTFSLGDKPAMARFVVTDSNGKVIKDFPNGVTLQIQLADPSTTLPGPYTGAIRSYDEATGQWNNQLVVNGSSNPTNQADRITNATVIDVGGGIKVLEFTAYHLSIWSLAYTGAGYCNASSLTLTGRPAGNSDGIDFQMIGTGVNSSFNKIRTGVTDNTLSLFFVPNFPVDVIARKNGNVVGTLPNVTFCSGTPPVAQPQTMALTGFVPTTPATLRVNVIEACSEDINVTRPGPTTVQFTPTGSTLPAGGWTGDDGSIDITKVFNPYNLEVDLNLNTGGTLKIWNRFTSLWDTVPQANASFTVDQALTTVNWRITTTCNVPTGTTGSTGQF